jgi:predicted nucleic acid-binding protein
MYVALAEILEAVLITTDRRLAAASGPTCRIDAR